MLLTIIQDPIEAALRCYFLINFRFIFVGFGIYILSLLKKASLSTVYEIIFFDI
jgi:hypothetical protein